MCLSVCAHTRGCACALTSMRERERERASEREREFSSVSSISSVVCHSLGDSPPVTCYPEGTKDISKLK